MQASQSELDLEKFAASILLDDEPLPAPDDLGPARASDSSLQGSSSEWEAMLIDNCSVETSNNGGTIDPGTACGTCLAMGFIVGFISDLAHSGCHNMKAHCLPSQRACCAASMCGPQKTEQEGLSQHF